MWQYIHTLHFCQYRNTPSSSTCGIAIHVCTRVHVSTCIRILVPLPIHAHRCAGSRGTSEVIISCCCCCCHRRPSPRWLLLLLPPSPPPPLPPPLLLQLLPRPRVRLPAQHEPRSQRHLWDAMWASLRVCVCIRGAEEGSDLKIMIMCFGHNSSRASVHCCCPSRGRTRVLKYLICRSSINGKYSSTYTSSVRICIN
jgi:hypothetical protein